ncbi:hypothetical protein B0H67DRAFT_571808 [Lasiosphaeris hirsuta]|uniref:Uncharacterized protein n=1 Tax=Lasiosphaeris hirsuta TaxID=260670 RepID=A0AA40E6K3_9PEZI|nr:hypothetical protein B0H67DRAFT_571808 [Lasiosphaeris hirsuta]
MVKVQTIAQGNKAFANERNAGLVFVFAGATSGIGSSTLERLASMVESATFHIIGRSASRFVAQHTRLSSLNPNLAIHFFEGDPSLLSDIDAFSQRIITASQKVDYLFLSPGLLPMAGPRYTKENLELCFALSYYSRLRLTSNLLPRLLASPHPRVLSVLNGGKEKKLIEDDLGLVTHWTPAAVIAQTTTLNTLAFEHLASQNKKLTFLHAFPGLVRTGIFSNLLAPQGAEVWVRVKLALLRALFRVLAWALGVEPEVAGERHAYVLTSPTYGPGSWLVNEVGDVMAPSGVVVKYKESGWPERAWGFTLGVFDAVLKRNPVM